MTDPISLVPPALRGDVQRLKAALAPHTQRAYLVGGLVRDHLLSRPCEDADIEVYDIAPERFEQLMADLGAKGVGKSFFVYKLGALDLSLPRSERQVGLGHRDFEVSWCNDPKSASSRRDFTINSLMVNLFDGRMLDFHGALADLEARRIVHIDQKAFIEDPLRVLRAMRFSAQLDFRIAPATAKLCRSLSLEHISSDRIYGEFERLFAAKYPARGLAAMRSLGVDRQVLGRTIGFGEFRQMVQDLGQMALSNLCPKVRFLVLPWLLRWRLRLSVERLCEAFHLPRRYCKALKEQPLPPTRANARYLYGLSLRLPLGDWLGLDRCGWRAAAQELGLLQAPFAHGVQADAVMASGFSGAELGREIQKKITFQMRKQNGRALPTTDRD